ncbi:hypothetical protein [Staphylococcus phage vB_SauM-V1SA09]|nr:hypothetical protein [Staphylococcus phage vB_ScaM-V1SC01]WOZ17303.1 hypothetical protein [Staphylococcus phage vB_SauM-V1SA09]WPF67580.1 hypothetical protein [Staphylococcus phage vB_SauM-V1SA12]
MISTFSYGERHTFIFRYGMEGYYHPESTVRYKASAGQHMVSLIHQVD